MSRILIIDDDEELAALFSDYLQQEGFEVETRHDGNSGLTEALRGHTDVVILDIMLPDIQGTEVLARLRTRSSVPVLMFTARGDDIDRIIGLESGADDYVPKPCTPRELVARIRAILRRMQPQQATVDEPVVWDALELWPSKRKVIWQGENLELTSTEFNLLEALARNGGQTVSKEILSEQGLGRPLERYDRSVDVHMSSIRHKLGNQADGRSWIQTVRGQGYQLIRA